MSENNESNAFRRLIGWLIMFLGAAAAGGVLLAVLAVSYKAIRWGLSQ
jgi:hypothetical protein